MQSPDQARAMSALRSALAQFSREELATELELDVRTSVDWFLPRLLLKFALDCIVVNGRFPERVARVLAGESTVCTRVIPK